ncbi:MAG: CBS domain-containing protein [Candidatus Hermodarchaeia archaeon]|jgi:CBS domain-containing protein
MKVKEVMKTEFARASVPGTRDTVLQIMSEHGTTAIPLVKKDTEELAGIVSRLDLMRKPEEDQLALLMNRDPPVVAQSNEVVDAIRILLEEGIRRLPVVDSKRRLKGMITVHQIIRKVISEQFSEKLITPFVQRQVTAVWENTPVQAAYTIMRLASTDVLPVISVKGDLVGIISVSDIMNLSEIVRERRSTSVSAASEGTDWSWDATTVLYIATNELQLPDKLVSEVMVGGIITTYDQATIGEATKSMRRHDIDQLPVTNAKGELGGIIRDKDLMRILLETQ